MRPCMKPNNNVTRTVRVTHLSNIAVVRVYLQIEGITRIL